jgi:hypothetical protein
MMYRAIHIGTHLVDDAVIATFRDDGVGCVLALFEFGALRLVIGLWEVVSNRGVLLRGGTGLPCCCTP